MLWMVLLDWLWRGNGRPRREVFVGLAFGLVGIGLLVGAGSLAGEGVDPVAMALVFGSLAWAFGSLYAQKSRLPVAPMMTTAMQMLAGGLGLALLSGMSGEWGSFQVSQVSTTSMVALAYLSLLGGGGVHASTSSLHHTTSARIATYAYVNRSLPCCWVGRWRAGANARVLAAAGSSSPPSFSSPGRASRGAPASRSAAASAAQVGGD
ncbi:MAG: hypothetical protein KIS91_01050 [Anaerolineae bacterium]|nr:hypothetical protein [Anaerolineae bacterium]